MADAADIANDQIDSQINTLVSQQRASLSSMSNQTGICRDCDEPIEQKRREALPFAQRCLECQADQEEKARHVR